MKTILKFAVLLAVVFAGPVVPSHADVLYSLNAISGDLATIDLSDGSRTTIATSNTGVGAMTFDRSRDAMYFTDGSDLLEIDRLTGNTDVLVSFSGNSSTISALAFDSQQNVLFGATIGSNNLVTIDRDSGIVQDVGAMGTNIAEFAFDQTTNTLFGVDNATDSLYSIDRVSGAATAVGSLNATGVLSIAADPLSGQLYAFDVGSVGAFSQLLNVNKTTGEATAIGPLGSNFIAAIAFAPVAVPEPNSILFLAGVLGCFWLKRQRVSN